MRVDERVLRSHASRRDPDLGIAESFVSFPAGRGRTLGVLSTPLQGDAVGGWVMCHSFGSEQLDLHLTETALARALARDGAAVLRFHCQGYGDSELVETPPSLSGHIADTADAVSYLRERNDGGSIGLIGLRFGGLVASHVASTLELPFLVVVDPVLDGRRFVRDLLRYSVMSGIARDAVGQDMSSARTTLEAGGAVNVNGFSLTSPAFEEIAGARFDEGLSESGRALLVQVSRDPQPKRSLAELRSRLGERSSLSVIADRAASTFGHHRFHEIADDVLGDALQDLTGQLVEAVTTWVRSLAVGAGR